MAASIVVIGASSFIGTHLLSSIPISGNREVRALVRTRDLASEQRIHNVHFFAGDLLQPESLKDLLEPGCIVINLAFLRDAGREPNLEALKNLADACAGSKVKRVIHCSTAMVHGDLKQDVINEDTSCTPTTLYETTKRDLERFLQNEYGSQFEVVILRPTAVFGPYGKNLVKLVDELNHGHRITGYLKACLFHSRRMNLVCVKNVVAAIWFLADPNRTLSESVYLISDDDQESNRYGHVRSTLMKELGVRADLLPIIPLPSSVAQVVLRLTGNPRSNPRQVYIGKTLSREGFISPVHLDQGLGEFASWILGGCQR